VRGLHLVVQDFQVRAQHQARGPGCGDAAQVLARLGAVGAGVDARVRVDDHARLAAPQGQHPHRAVRVRRAVAHGDLLLERHAVGEQERAAMRLGAFAVERDGVALQLVGAAAGEQGLAVARPLRQARLQMVGDAVLRIGRHHAQVLQRGPGAQLQVQLQVLHQGATAGAARFALVQLDEFELRARLQLQHQEGRLDLGARLVAQLQAQRTRAGGDAQAQAAAAQRTMRPAERRGILVTGQRQAGEQLGALARVGGVEPARLEARRRLRAERAG
jgi:hypothetical protein